MSNIVPEVTALLDQYEQYKSLLSEVSEIDSKLAKAKLLRTDQSTLQAKKSIVVKRLENLSDEMTFANPLIWIQYKYLAYADEAQPIRTMHDLRVHCSKPGYICTKRYTFLNDYLVKSGEKPLSDQATYEDNLSLSELLTDKNLQTIVNDVLFQKQWSSYEYFKDNDKVAKWENYSN